ncbi:MAG: TIGR03617 family F420-dependent LLM class oxidoreductase [Pseudomonadales bacterium]
MKIDAAIGGDLKNASRMAKEIENLGYDGLMTAELANDPFFPLVLSAENTEKLELRTAIAVAFARNPMIMANIGHDLNSLSRGRMTLGLGSQIKPHIEKRFNMPWHGPAKQMKEFVQAMRAIWACWHDGSELKFEGGIYRNTLMTPMFTPQDRDYGPPKVVVAGVGPKMIQTAAEVADGLIVHSFNTAKYLQESIMPVLHTTLEKNGKTIDSFEVSYPMFFVTGETEEEFEKQKADVRHRIAFYGSTPAYRAVLEAHGWEDLQPELNRMSKEGKWEQMDELITDEILNEFAVVGELHEIASKTKQRVGGLVDRVTFMVPVKNTNATRELLTAFAD